MFYLKWIIIEIIELKMANKCVLDKKGKKTGKRKNQTTENFPNISNRQKCFEKRARRVERLKMKSGDDFVKKDILMARKQKT